VNAEENFSRVLASVNSTLFLLVIKNLSNTSGVTPESYYCLAAAIIYQYLSALEKKKSASLMAFSSLSEP
jgi:hypothetical protein